MTLREYCPFNNPSLRLLHNNNKTCKLNSKYFFTSTYFQDVHIFLFYVSRFIFDDVFQSFEIKCHSYLSWICYILTCREKDMFFFFLKLGLCNFFRITFLSPAWNLKRKFKLTVSKYPHFTLVWNVFQKIKIKFLFKFSGFFFLKSPWCITFCRTKH